jgi:hypothetical protein
MLAAPVKSVFALDVMLTQMSTQLAEGFGDGYVVYVLERRTGLLLGDSEGEGVQNADGDRICATGAANSIIRRSALQLEAIGYIAASLVLDENRITESSVYQLDKTSTGWGVDWLIVAVRTVVCPIGQFLEQVRPTLFSTLQRR